ncbi:uncharacterized protein ACN427_014397 [Glossina fuscipes fuscipes]
MSYELCSALQCNVCLAFVAFPEPNKPTTETQPPMRACSGCHLVKYCGKDHQKKDWRFHGEFCCAVQRIKSAYNVKHPLHLSSSGREPETIEEMETAQMQLKFLLTDTLKRPLKTYEEEIISFPSVCGVCVKLKDSHVCPHCRSQAYCSLQHLAEHSIEHKKVCHLLRLYYCPYKVKELPTDFKLNYIGRVNNLHKSNLMTAFETVFNLKLPTKPYETLKDYQLFAYASDFSCIATICFSMCHLDILSMETNKFIIYIVGSSVEPRLWFQKIHTQFFFMQYPLFTTLELHFIGPETLEAMEENIKYDFLGQERYVHYICYKGLFQEYVSYFKGYPSLIVAFNCGFSEYSQLFKGGPATPKLPTLPAAKSCTTTPTSSTQTDAWQKGIWEMLLFFRIPIVFTSFTKLESEFDFAALRKAADIGTFKMHVERIFTVSKNPFHDLRPLRQFHSDDDEAFYFRNGYIQAIHTLLKK